MTDTAYTETGANDHDEDAAYAAWAATRETREPVMAPEPKGQNPFRFVDWNSWVGPLSPAKAA